MSVKIYIYSLTDKTIATYMKGQRLCLSTQLYYPAPLLQVDYSTSQA